MKKFILLLLIGFSFVFNNEIQAQSFSNAVGLRLGYPVSVSYKQFISETGAFEVYAGTRGYFDYRWMNISAAYQKHAPLDDIVPGLEWYWGVGASAFLYSFDNTFVGEANNLGLGAQGYLGVQYNFEDMPVNVTVDWVPTFFLSGYISGAGFGYGSLAVRYILN